MVGDVSRQPRRPARYPRMARVNEVVREALGDELERLNDPRLGLVTITGVDVERRPAAGDRLLFRARARGEAGYGGRAGTCTGATGHHARRVTGGGAASARRVRTPGAAEVHARAHLPRGPGRRRRATASRRSSATSTATTQTDPRRVTRRPSVDVDARRGRRSPSPRPIRSRSPATSTPTATRSARCSGLFHVLRADGRDVVGVVPAPVRRWRRTTASCRASTSSRTPDDFPREPDVMVTFDCGSLGRLGDLEPAAKAARELIVLDHHVSNTRYGTINVIDPDAAASGVLVRRLVLELGPAAHRRRRGRAVRRARVRHRALPVRDHHARASSTSRASSSRFDVPVSRLSRQLFEEHRFAYLKLLGEALAAAELDVERRFVWTAVTQDMLERHGVTLEEVEGLIDIVRRTTEAEVTCVLKEEADGIGAGEPALARRRRRPRHRGRPRRGRPPLRRRLRVDPRHRRRSSRPSATPSEPCERVMRDGLVVVDKPAGCTSHDVVAKLRKVYGQRRVGHAGTLDPDATGVLLVGLGRATRLLRYLSETGKAYRGRDRVRHRDQHARRRRRGARPAPDAAHARRRRARAAGASSATSSSCRRWCRR